MSLVNKRLTQIGNFFFWHVFKKKIYLLLYLFTYFLEILELKMADISGRYPPTEFSQKYAAVLAPKGKLVSPSDVFGENGVFGDDVEEKTRQAFRVTMKKLDKLNSKSELHKEDLVREKIDQVSFFRT